MTAAQEPLCPRCGSDKWQWTGVSRISDTQYRNCCKCRDCKMHFGIRGEIRNTARAHLVAVNPAARMVNAQTVRNED